MTTAEAAGPAAPSDVAALRERTVRLARLGRADDCAGAWLRPGVATEENLRWLDRAAWQAMDGRDFTAAGELGRLFALVRWRGGADPDGRPAVPPEELPPLPVPHLSVPKLRHDVEQFRHLRARGVLGAGYDTVVAAYEAIAERLTAEGRFGQVPMTPADAAAVGHVYNRLVHLGTAPRLDRALGDGWDRRAVEESYLADRCGIVVIDDLLSPRALDSLRAFCLESTVWSANRYAHGRLGAFFRDGFNCPLLLQIAEELADALPRVIGDRYPLRQLWAFKNGPDLPRSGHTHADFAAVNVNFWITPTEANLDPGSGGLVVHRADAPPDWDFDTYNGRPDVIGSYLASHGVDAIRVPYRANRAVLFNSDLFHGTDGVRFRPGYENHRINITLLYGEREDDVDHRNPQRDLAAGSRAGGVTASWRSAAFGRARR
ncbi:phytanoyl-CoA dioxygenase family protein [Streptomyces antibioticus]|uniref:hypothetical protein n=1 Tax=Streptomyces antibioticus TaxID=1890 RepID=UPI00225657D1|nr:hypothetical protein [Streptomyces antibioticus]MCX4741140.1 hypothetical protein [Streptomyces antibioticus]